jgi:hypothetical protein
MGSIDGDERLALVEGMARVVRDYRLDMLEAFGVKIVRSRHEAPAPAQAASTSDGDIDELMAYAGA